MQEPLGVGVALRGTAHPKGKQAEGSAWRPLWSGAPHYPEAGAREFRPPIDSQAAGELVSAVEVTLDTTGWTGEWWSEIDAVRLDGHLPEQKQQAAAGNEAGAPEWLKRQLWESDAAFASRARFVRERFGAAPPADEAEALLREVRVVAQAADLLQRLVGLPPDGPAASAATAAAGASH